MIWFVSCSHKKVAEFLRFHPQKRSKAWLRVSLFCCWKKLLIFYFIISSDRSSLRGDAPLEVWQPTCFLHFDHLCHYIKFSFLRMECRLIMIDADGGWLMLIDTNCCWLVLIVSDWCWLTLIDADWCCWSVQPSNFVFTHWIKQIVLQGFTDISNSSCRSKFQEKISNISKTCQGQQGGERRREGEQPSGWKEQPKSRKEAFWQKSETSLRSRLPNQPDRSKNPFQAILIVFLWFWVISIYLLLQWGLQCPCGRGCRRAAWSTIFSTNQVVSLLSFLVVT